MSHHHTNHNQDIFHVIMLVTYKKYPDCTLAEVSHPNNSKARIRPGCHDARVTRGYYLYVTNMMTLKIAPKPLYNTTYSTTSTKQYLMYIYLIFVGRRNKHHVTMRTCIYKFMDLLQYQNLRPI